MSALERAVDNLDVGIAELLLARGADPDCDNVYKGELPTDASVSGYAGMQFLDAYPLASMAEGDDLPEGLEMTLPGYAGLYALCDPATSHAEFRLACITMRSFLASRRAKYFFRKWREAIKARGIVMFWLGAAMETTCAEGGRGRARDRAAFVADESLAMPAFASDAARARAEQVPTPETELVTPSTSRDLPPTPPQVF